MNIESSTDAGLPAIDFRHVTIRFDNTPALDDVSLALAQQSMVCITGAAGSGKSVLIRLATGLLSPDEGEVLIEGCNLASLDETELLELRGNVVGMVFQETSLFTALSVYENAAYRLSERGWPEKDTEAATMEILRFVGLEHDVEKLPEELSIGMRRRLEFARAMAGWPRIMLFDEPASGLDPINARNILDLVIRARDIHRISSLFVTKAPWEIRYLSSHHAVQDSTTSAITIAQGSAPNQVDVIVLDAGRVAFCGSVTELESSAEPAVVRLIQPPEDKKHAGEMKDPWSRTKKWKSRIAG